MECWKRALCFLFLGCYVYCRGCLFCLGVNGNFAFDALFERDKGLGRHYARYALHLVVQQIHQLLVVLCIQLYQHGVGACGEVTLYNLGDGEQTLHHIFIHAAALKVQTYIGAGRIAQALGVYVKSAASDDAALHEVLHTLVNGCARHAALGSDILEGYACIFREDTQYLLVQFVNFIHVCMLRFVF